MKRQHGMPLDKQIMAVLYHFVRLNVHWFRIDELLCPETDTFHMLSRECTITLQDVVYQLGLQIYGEYVSGCLIDFETYIEGGRPPWTWFKELLRVLPLANYIDKFTIKCIWMQEIFSELPQGVDEKTVRRYVRAYIMMLLSNSCLGTSLGHVFTSGGCPT
ncbi:hypothetical protein Ahy_B06g080832 [Arachis hypogaea]|uniref:Aminotransferase-like plant mobile domain-containing protein n=1 Tax=Arachis hypogaea TaxID=3818 RepID=A0A444YJ44_ARAHY|nr:hypothetical protein Ahy_B06g080832 [Arachis hypogaea]